MIRKSAKGMPCQVRLSICNNDPETTVLAHRNGYCLGKKYPDFIGAYACSSCHDAVDGRLQTDYSSAELKQYLDDAIFRTQLFLYERGLIKIRGSK